MLRLVLVDKIKINANRCQLKCTMGGMCLFHDNGLVELVQGMLALVPGEADLLKTAVYLCEGIKLFGRLRGLGLEAGTGVEL